MPDQDEQWVVFWCSLLKSALLGEIPEGALQRHFQELSQQERQLPNGERRRISVRTIRRRWRRLKDEGIPGLYRRSRSDLGQPRRQRADLFARAAELKRDQPRDSDKDINRILEQEFGRTIPSSTMYRHLRRVGATRHTLNESSVRTTLRFKIKNLPDGDKQQLKQWRNSGNKSLWEKAVAILDSRDSTLDEICAKTERSSRSINRWIELYNRHGIEGLQRKSRDRSKSDEKKQAKTRRILDILHDRPRSYGINRSNWNLSSLAIAYESRHGELIGKSTIGRLINDEGYSFRKARRVFTSPDPNYRERVELVLQTLQSLTPTELFFFVDEMGPVRVKSYGGRCYSPKKVTRTYVDGQTSKGSVTLSGALSATTNQVAWFYGIAKDTLAMIDLAEILYNQYYEKSRLFITWDAASWHSSNALLSWLDSFNAKSQEIGEGPAIELVPLPSRSQFLDVIESIFSGVKRAVIHHSNYASQYEMKTAISAHFVDRNDYFRRDPRRVGRKIWEADFFEDFKNILAGDYREW